MNFDELINKQQTLTLGDLGDVKDSAFFNVVKELDLEDTFTPTTLLSDIPDLIDQLPEDAAQRLRSIEIGIGMNATLPPESPTPAVGDLKELASPGNQESNGRIFIGSLFCLVMAFTIITFTVGITVVAISRDEFPSATLCAIIVLPTMYVAWYYMGIFNKERRDILSALVGNKVSPSMVSSVIEAIRKPRI